MTNLLTPPGPLMLDVAGQILTESERQRIANPWVGAVILFSRNYDNPEQLIALTKSIREVDPSILIAVDHEGGRVQRFRSGFSRIPAMATFEKLFIESPSEARGLLQDTGWLLASELTHCGIDFSFAPVLDLDFKHSQIIGDRAFSNDPEVVVELAGALIKGMHEAGMIVTGKHFPGHGWVRADSHIDIPVDDRSYDDIRQADLIPFQRLSTNGLDAVMPAHIIYSAVDDKPAGFSPYWLQTILRQELQFEGVIFSDDLSMEGASVAGSYAQRAEQALIAGCDMILVCNQPQGALEVIEFLEQLRPVVSSRLEKLRTSSLWQPVDKLRQQSTVASLNGLCGADYE